MKPPVYTLGMVKAGEKVIAGGMPGAVLEVAHQENALEAPMYYVRFTGRTGAKWLRRDEFEVVPKGERLSDYRVSMPVEIE